MDPNNWSNYNQHYGRIAHSTALSGAHGALNRYDLLEQGLSASGLGTLSPTLSPAHAALPTTRSLAVGTLPPMSYGHPLHNMSQFLDTVNPLQPSFTGPSPYKAVPVSQAGYPLDMLAATCVSHEPPTAASLASRYAAPPSAITSHGSRSLFGTDLVPHPASLVKEVSYASHPSHPPVSGTTTTSRGWGLSNFVPANSSPFSNIPEGVAYGLSQYSTSPPLTRAPSPPTNTTRSSTIQRNPYQPERSYTSGHSENRPTPPPLPQSPYHAPPPAKPSAPPPSRSSYHIAPSSRPTPPPVTAQPTYQAVPTSPVPRMLEERSSSARSHLDNMARMQPSGASLHQSRHAEDLSRVTQPEDLTRMPPLAHIHKSHRVLDSGSHVSQHREEVPVSTHCGQQDYLGRTHGDSFLGQSSGMTNLSPSHQQGHGMVANSPQDLHITGRNNPNSPLPTTISQTPPKSNAPSMSQAFSLAPISPQKRRQHPVHHQNVFDPYSHRGSSGTTTGTGYSSVSSTPQYPPVSQITSADMNYDPVSPATPETQQQNDNFSTISLQDLHSIGSHQEQLLGGNVGQTNTRMDLPEMSPHIVMTDKPPKEKSKSKEGKRRSSHGHSKGSRKTSQESTTADVHLQDSTLYSSSGSLTQQNVAFSPSTSPMGQTQQQFHQEMSSIVHQAQFKHEVENPMRPVQQQFKHEIHKHMHQDQQFKQDMDNPMRPVQEQFKQEIPKPMHQDQNSKQVSQFSHGNPSPIHQTGQFSKGTPSPIHQAGQYSQGTQSPIHQAHFSKGNPSPMQQVGQYSQGTSSPMHQGGQFSQQSPIHQAGKFSQGTRSPLQQSPISVGSPTVPGSTMMPFAHSTNVGASASAPSVVQTVMPAIQAVADSTTIAKPKRRGRKKKQAAIVKTETEPTLSNKPFQYQEMNPSGRDFPLRMMDDTSWMQKTLTEISAPKFKSEMGMMMDRKALDMSSEYKSDLHDGMPDLKPVMMGKPPELLHSHGVHVPLTSVYEASVPSCMPDGTGHLSMGPFMGENILEHKGIMDSSDSEYFPPPPALPMQPLEEHPSALMACDGHDPDSGNSVEEKVFLSNTYGSAFGNVNEAPVEPSPGAELTSDDPANFSDQLIDAALGPESSDLGSCMSDSADRLKMEPVSLPKAVTSALEFDEDFQHLTSPPKVHDVPIKEKSVKQKAVKQKTVKQKPPVEIPPVVPTIPEVKPPTETSKSSSTAGGSSAFLSSFMSFIQGKKGETLSSVTQTPVQRPPMPKYVPEPRRPRIVKPASPTPVLSDSNNDNGSNSQNMLGTVESEESNSKVAEQGGSGGGSSKPERIWTSLGRSVRGRGRARAKAGRSGGGPKGKGKRHRLDLDYDSAPMSTDEDGTEPGETGEEKPTVLEEEEEIPTSVRRSSRAKVTRPLKSKKRKHNSDDSEDSQEAGEAGEAGEATYTSTEEEIEYDSDKDPAWTPFAADKKQTTLETMPLSRFRRTSGGRGRTPVGRARGKGHRRSSAYMSPEEESSREEANSDSLPADQAEGEQEWENPIQLPLVNEGQGSYQKGTYLIEKRDLTNYENYPIWRVSEGKMLQKFELLVNKSRVSHKSTFTYSSWTPLMYDQFETIRVRMVMRDKNREVVEVVEEDRPTPPTDGSLERQYEDDPMVENFNVYLQILLSQALEPGFLKAIQNSDDEFYTGPLQKVDEMVQTKIEQIDKLANWMKDFKEAVKNRPHLRELDRPNLKQSCQACLHVSQPAIKSVHLFGDPYDRVDLSDLPKDCTVTSQEFMVGKKATQYLSTYHSLLHYKYNLYKRCIAKVNIVRESQGKDENSEVLDQCLHNRAWVLKLFEDLKKLLDKH